jgi:hypothetical protein
MSQGPRNFDLEFHFATLLNGILNACALVHHLERRANFDIGPVFFAKSNYAFQPDCPAYQTILRCRLPESDNVVVMAPLYGVRPVLIGETPRLREDCQACGAEHGCAYGGGRL